MLGNPRRSLDVVRVRVRVIFSPSHLTHSGFNSLMQAIMQKSFNPAILFWHFDRLKLTTVVSIVTKTSLF